jgi:hypothetical protein
MIGFMSIFPGRPAQVGPAHNAQSPILPKSPHFAYFKLHARNPAAQGSMVFPQAALWTTMPPSLDEEEAMRADRVELSWDATKSNWLIRIISGEEVIRRHLKARQDADDTTLLASAQQEVRDEGYEADAAQVSIRR